MKKRKKKFGKIPDLTGKKPLYRTIKTSLKSIIKNDDAGKQVNSLLTYSHY